MPAPELAVVMPTRNEGGGLEATIREWVEELRRRVPDFRLFVLNDGSTDGTSGALASLEAEIGELRVMNKARSGHGQTCMEGYETALASGAPWILQIDSDGQCDPRDFSALWEKRLQAPVLFGVRVARGDGWRRRLISRCAAIAVLLATGRWIQDANVPFRLMSAGPLADALRDPGWERVDLANVWLAARLAAKPGICWVPIGFRARRRDSWAGWSFFASRGLRLFRELRATSRRSSAAESGTRSRLS